MKLDVNALRYLSREELRTLQAVELGQKNVRCDIAALSFKLDQAPCLHGGSSQSFCWCSALVCLPVCCRPQY